MRDVYIFDLDGTLANAEHRMHFIHGETKDWAGFFGAVLADSPIWPVIHLLRELRARGNEIWVWTGRSEECKAQTLIWLNNYKVFDGRSFRHWEPDGLNFRMRRHGDHRPDDQIKCEWLLNLHGSVQKRIQGVFEDRDRVVAMWRANGLQCFQVAPGNF